MTTYKISKNGVLRIDGANIPSDPDNRDWREYQEWLAKGNSADPEFTAAELAAEKKKKSDERKHRAKKEKNKREARADNDDTLAGLARRVLRLEEELDYK